MRAIMIAMVVLTGCLHSQTPLRSANDGATLHEFTLLVNDPVSIKDAAAFAAARHLGATETRTAAAAAYERYMRVEAYDFAAEVAWRFGLGQAALDLPMGLQRRTAARESSEYSASRRSPDAEGLRRKATWSLRAEALIGCVYSGRKSDAKAAVDDAVAYSQETFDKDPLLALLELDCPLDYAMRDIAIEEALSRGKDDFAIFHASRSGWIIERKARFTWELFYAGRCGSAFRAAAALGLGRDDIVPMIEKADCERASISDKGWSLAADDAGAYFFAAVRNGKYNLALRLLPFCGFEGNGPVYVFQEALRSGRGADLIKVFQFHSGLHEGFMNYAFERGRYRFVGLNAQSYDWEMKAFEKLIELGQYDFAAEVAEYGFSETLRSIGVGRAFEAAMANGDFKSGRYFVARYGPIKGKPGLVTQQMYDEAQKKWYAARAASMPPPPARPKAKPATRRDACPKGDWCVGNGK